MTVYVIQQQMKFDQQQGKLVPRFNGLEKAQRWGRLDYLLPPSAHPFNTEIVLGDIHDKLNGYSDEDHLLLIGNPALIGMVCSIAAHYNDGRIKLLQWSGSHQDYTEIVAKIY